jgi:hypothetical protein
MRVLATLVQLAIFSQPSHVALGQLAVFWEMYYESERLDAGLGLHG